MRELPTLQPAVCRLAMAVQTSSLGQPCHDINLLRLFCKCRDAVLRKILDGRHALRAGAFQTKAQGAKDGWLSGFVQNGARRCFDRLRQFNRSQNGRATAPAQNPTLDFRKTGQFQTQLDAAILRFVFHRIAPNINELPQRTTLERAIVAHLREGRHWRDRTGWLTL